MLKLAVGATANGLLSPELAAGICMSHAAAAGGRIQYQSSAAMIARAADTISAASHPMDAASTGVSAGEIRPPMLLPMFITPPPAPLRAPATAVMVAQNGPSTLRTSAVANARHVAARYLAACGRRRR